MESKSHILAAVKANKPKEVGLPSLKALKRKAMATP